jgi:hypothetical protein
LCNVSQALYVHFVTFPVLDSQGALTPRPFSGWNPQEAARRKVSVKNQQCTRQAWHPLSLPCLLRKDGETQALSGEQKIMRLPSTHALHYSP